MTQPKKIPIGQKRSRFPGGTLNALVEDFYQRRGRTARPNLTRPNEAISPSIVRLWWEGEDPIGVGSEVKLGEVLVKPENDPSAPFQGLQFRCSAPASDDEGGSVYAITTAPGPANSIVWGLMPSATWAKVDVQDEADTHASHGDGLLLTTGTSGYPIVWKEDGTGEKWAVVSLVGSRISTAIAAETIDARDGLPPGDSFGQGLIEFPDGSQITAVNRTGVPIWGGSSLIVAYADNDASALIIESNAADVLYGEFTGGDPNGAANYTWSSANKLTISPISLDTLNFPIEDPQNARDGMVAGDVIVVAIGGPHASAPNVLNVIAGPASGGGGGFAWPGPGAGPNAGTATVSICKAFVNQAGGVASGASVPFDGATAIIGTIPGGGAGTATINADGLPFFDNEEITIVSTNAGGWAALKGSANIFLAEVNGDTLESSTIAYVSGSALHGAAPPASGTLVNWYAQEYAHGQKLICIQPNGNGNRYPLTPGGVFHLVKGVPSATVNGSGSPTFTVTTPALVRGMLPSGGITVNNASPATVRATTSETMVYEYDRTAGATIATRWRPSTAWNHWQRKKAISGYDGTKIQVEGHDNSGNETWFDTTLCNVSS